MFTLEAKRGLEAAPPLLVLLALAEARGHGVETSALTLNPSQRPPTANPNSPSALVTTSCSGLCAHSEIRLHSNQPYARLERHLLFTGVPAGRLQLDPEWAVGGIGGVSLSVCLSVLQL